jgi:Spy/CpxP family protein refolding chaperone
MRSLPLPFVLLLLALWPGVLGAQVGEEPDPFSAVLFTPEEIMEHGRAIGLNDEQRDAITRLIEDLQGRAVALQWRLLDETTSVKEALEGPRVDLDRVLDRFNQALDTEMDIKRAHLELLVRIKNVLTLAQQERLRELRDGGPREDGGTPGATEGPGGTAGSPRGLGDGHS